MNGQTQSLKLDQMNQTEKDVFFQLLDDFLTKKKEKKREIRIKSFLNILDEQKGPISSLKSNMADDVLQSNGMLSKNPSHKKLSKKL